MDKNGLFLYEKARKAGKLIGLTLFVTFTQLLLDMSKYRRYVDEVGNSDLGSSDNENHRFLSLTGIAIELDYVSKVIYPELESLKKKYFKSHPDDPVILHRKELVKKKPPFTLLKEKKIEDDFNNEFLALLEKWEFTILSVIVDKKEPK